MAGESMTLKELVKTFVLTGKKQTPHQLYTKWGEEINDSNILTEYPRPQLMRENYFILNMRLLK